MPAVGILSSFRTFDFDTLLPSLEMGLPRWAHVRYDLLRDIRNLVGFAADETEQRCGERPADFGSFSFPRPSRSLQLFRRW
jgi:hypothetical protein